MKDQLISRETAIAAKAKGCNLPAKWAYPKEDRAYGDRPEEGDEDMTGKPWRISWVGLFDYAALTQTALARWLRETQRIFIEVRPNPHYCYQVRLTDLGYPEDFPRFLDDKWLAHDYGTYEGALEAGLAHALAQLK